jgi:hypothetical protein
MSNQDETRPEEVPLESVEPSAAPREAAPPAAETGRGMGASEPVFVSGEVPPLPKGARTPQLEFGGGMSASYPIIRDEETPPSPGLPAEEMKRPPQEAMRGAPIFSAAAYELPGPTSGLGGQQPPELSAERVAKEEMITLLVPDKAVQALWTRADTAVETINSEINTLQIGRTLFDHIKSFRNEIMSGKDRYEEAERHLNEAEYRVAIIRRVKGWSAQYGLGLFFYEILWGVMVIAILFGGLGATVLEAGALNITYMVACMMFGGLGGAIGALFSLIKHISVDQDFDIQHRMWYLGSPIMGVGVGAVTYLIMKAGLLSISGPQDQGGSPFVLYVLAFLAGYQHNIFTDIVKRVLKVFEGTPAEKPGGVEVQTTPTPAAVAPAVTPQPAPSQPSQPAPGGEGGGAG